MKFLKIEDQLRCTAQHVQLSRLTWKARFDRLCRLATRLRNWNLAQRLELKERIQNWAYDFDKDAISRIEKNKTRNDSYATYHDMYSVGLRRRQRKLFLLVSFFSHRPP